jgi:lipopolysaccharide export system protein LptA
MMSVLLRHIVLRLGCSFVLIALCAPAQAQDKRAAGQDKLIVTADETLEWHRNENRFYARGTAMAKRGDSRIHGDTLIAHYRDSQENNFDIYKLVAEGSVRIVSDESTAYGARAVYDVDKRRAVMTGNDLRLVTPDQTVFADKRFVYDVRAGQFTALGNARIERETTTLKSDKLVAGLVTNDNGKRVIETAKATGNVRITTPQETVTGERAVYARARDEVEITGGVTVKRGRNTLHGARAVVDLETQVSRMFSGTDGKGDGRVRGVFYPEQDRGAKAETGPKK